MASFIRDSKFRHTVISVDKREKHYEQLKVANHQHEGNALAASSAFLAYMDVAGGGSAIAVLPLSSVGKNHIPVLAPSYQQPLIRAHSQPVQDFSFNRFRNNILYSCSTDSTFKVWNIPTDGYVVDCSAHALSMNAADGAPLKGLAPHSTVDNLVAARGNREVYLFDVEAGSQTRASIDSKVTGDIQSMSWSYCGDLLAVTAKDKMLRLLDLRAADRTVVAEAAAHSGIRPSRTTWLGDSPFLASFGHSSTQERELLVFDSRNMSSVYKRERIDNSLGVVMPFFDPDTNLLILAGKGDCAMRLYEFDFKANEESSEAALFPVANTPVGEMIRGAALLPKQANDLMSCEVLRLLKLTDSAVQPISLTVPRKEKFKYHEDLFPPTIWEAPPALAAAAWMNGENSPPLKIDIQSPSSERTQLALKAENLENLENMDESGDSFSATVSPSAASTLTSAVSSPRSRPMSYGSSLKFRNMYGTENPKNKTFFNLRPNTLSDSPLLACSDLYWAVPYQGSGGGPVYVSRNDAFGKVEPECSLINGHKSAVSDLAFSPFHNGLLATASNDCTIKLWQLPEDAEDPRSLSLPSMGDEDAVCRLTSHRHSIRTVNFHPTVAGLLVSSSQDMTVRLFDINKSEEISCLRLGNAGEETALPTNISFNYDGSLISIAGKDRVVRAMDLRTGEFVLSTPEPSNTVLGRNLRAVWCTSSSSDGSLFCVSSAPSGLRTVHLWDPRNMNHAVCTRVIDNGAGQLFPMYDESAGVCFVAGRGDTIIRYFELTFLNPNEEPGFFNKHNCEKGSDFQGSREAMAGVCLLPKRLCNVGNVEVSRLLKLTVDSVIPVSFTLPRAEGLKQYFQDDIYLPIRSREPAATTHEWTTKLGEEDRPLFYPQTESLQPDGMMKLSDKPAERAVKTQSAKFREVINKQEEEAKQREETFNKLQEMAIQRSVYHPNPSGGGHGFKVDQKPVHDSDSDNDWDD